MAFFGRFLRPGASCVWAHCAPACWRKKEECGFQSLEFVDLGIHGRQVDLVKRFTSIDYLIVNLGPYRNENGPFEVWERKRGSLAPPGVHQTLMKISDSDLGAKKLAG